MTSILSSGIPSSPDVYKLLARFKLQPGVDIPHEEVEACIGVARGTSRYRSVTTAWRRRVEREQNLFVDSTPSKGFRVLLPTERVSHCMGKVASGARIVRKSGARAAMIPPDTLSDADRGKAMHMVKLAAQIDADVKQTMRQIAPPSRSAIAPQRPMPEGAS